MLLSPALISALDEVLNAGDSAIFLNRDDVLRALGRPGLKAAVPVLLRALNDREDSVRSSAARALAVIGPDAREAIPALKTLASSAELIERREARSALIALGEGLSNPANYFERMEQYLHDRVAREPIQEFTEATLGPWPSGADGVFFVVDRSGTSLEGLRFSQRYIPRVLASLGEGSEFGVVFVDRQANSFPNSQKPAKWSKEELSATSEFIQKMGGGSGSCPTEGFNSALAFTEASSARRKAIVYIGDGGGTCGGLQEADYLERMCEDITRKNGGKAEIQAIGVSAGPFGEAVLLNLTERNGGIYRRLVRPQ